MKQDVRMKTVGMVLATLALLGTSLFPLGAEAQTAPAVVPHAICTQIEPIYRRNGVSFYNGESMCTVVAAIPDFFGYMPAAFDPGPAGMVGVCTYYVTSAHDEYAVAWSQPGYEQIAADFCYSLRIQGVDIQFVDHRYT